MAEKTVKAKQPEKAKQAETHAPRAEKKVSQPPKPKTVQKAKSADRDRDKPKQPNAIQRWWRETMGELHKVSWPTTQEAWQLTRIVLVVMFAMSAILGVLDFLFSRLITLLIA